MRDDALSIVLISLGSLFERIEASIPATHDWILNRYRR